MVEHEIKTDFAFKSHDSEQSLSAPKVCRRLIWPRQAKLTKNNNVFISNYSNLTMHCNSHSSKYPTAWNLTFQSQKIIILCCVLTPQCCLTMGLSCRSTMHNAVQRCITYQNGYLSSPAFLLQPTSSPHMPLYTSWTDCVENPVQ